jgi:peptidoglycan/LPS O-acetylase OafA/YrhL
MNHRVPALDLLRSLAIISVLLVHTLVFFNNSESVFYTIFSFGWIGVDLFFLLSGFLIGNQAFKTSDSTPNPILTFIVKRLFRTLPLYYVVLFTNKGTTAS